MRNIVLNSERFGSRVVFLETCQSTNDLALEYLKSGESKEPVVFVTDHQTKGRGQRGNVWLSEKGVNLTFSVLWHPVNLLISEQFVLNQISSLAIAKMLVDFGVKQVKVKWPNDVYVEQDKIAGILIENLASGKRIKSSVIGIGLNINQKPVEGMNMVSLAELIQVKVSKEVILEKLIKNLDYFLNAAATEQFDLHYFYEENLYAYKILTQFKNTVGENFVGQIVGVDPNGLLRIDVDGEEQRFAFKEVTLCNILE